VPPADLPATPKEAIGMYNIFYLIGVVVVVLALLSFLGIA
jgi:hypothetical protein